MFRVSGIERRNRWVQYRTPTVRGDVSASRVCWMGDFTWAFWVHKILAAMMVA